MPIYEYQCQDCEHKLEALQKLSDTPLQDCPECEQPRLKKLISAAGFRLKGGGWYETDFKTGNKKNLATSGDSSAKPSASTGGAKSAD
jgi:putative FmdB family regulatory protein